MGVDNLGRVAKEINATSKEQEILLDNLNKDVENSNAVVKFVTDLTSNAIKQSGGQCRCAIIVFLIVAFFILLMVMVFA
jgi:t-SNARE complex subunit (syntaxin)